MTHDGLHPAVACCGTAILGRSALWRFESAQSSPVAGLVGGMGGLGKPGAVEHDSTLQSQWGRYELHPTLAQLGGPPFPSVTTGVPNGNLLLATTPKSPTAGNDNSISFVTSDPGSFNQATADFYFEVTPPASNPTSMGVGMSFALLNTANYGTSGAASSLLPQQGIYNGSLAFGFDTTNDAVYLSLNATIVSAQSLTGQLVLASNQFIHAHAVIDFSAATVTLVLTPTHVGTPVTVFNGTSVPGLAPYESRVSFEAKNSSAAFADFNLQQIDVEYSGALSPGTFQFGTIQNVPENLQSGLAPIPIVRQIAPGFLPTGSFSVLVVAADGTAENNVNYLAEIKQQDSSGNLVVDPIVTFAATDIEKIVYVPILDDHLDDGNKTVNLDIGQYLGNPTVTAPLESPIVATLTIVNTDLPAPTVSPKVQLVYAAHTRMVTAFRLQFSQPMASTSAQTVSNYEVLLPPAYKNGPVRVASLSQAVLDPSGLFVTLYRASLGQHLTKLFQIVVLGKPPTGLIGANGTFLAGTDGVSGTDAVLTVSI